MVTLTESEQEWLRKEYPMLTYEKNTGSVSGTVFFRLNYNERTIADSYRVKIDLSSVSGCGTLPNVYNIDNRIEGIAKKKNIDVRELHVNHGGALCLILPEKMESRYPNGFNIQSFMQHLCEHLYWISYFDRYNEEPWKSEKHGDKAVLEFLCTNADDTLQDRVKFARLHRVYKKVFRKGVTKAKLLKILRDQQSVEKLLENI